MDSKSPTDHLEGQRSTTGAAIVAGGFASTLVLWSAWFVTHIPWLELDEQVALPITLACWALALGWTGWRAGNRRGAVVGANAGLIAAAAGLLILGSKLTEATDPMAMAGASVRPNAGLMAGGFVVMGAVLGAICGSVGGALAGARQRAMTLGTFGIVTVCAIAPLVFIGGLVTSTNSGMAVPDWPNTFGTNMFLYPLGPRVSPDIFFEHSHRLFGTLVGLTALVLLIWTLRSREHREVRPWVIGLFALIVAQGVLGGLRVQHGSTEAAADNRWLSMLHGIKGQLVFALAVVVAVLLIPAYRATVAMMQGRAPLSDARRLRFFATAAFHSTIVQLVFGAMYRHTRSDHALWTHAGFALIVAGFALLAGFAAANAGQADQSGSDGPPLFPLMRRIGVVLVVVVGLQFTLGWATFLVGGRTLQAESPAQALLRTAHQANGAAMLGLLTGLFLMARVMSPKRAAKARSTVVSEVR